MSRGQAGLGWAWLGVAGRGLGRHGMAWHQNEAVPTPGAASFAFRGRGRYAGVMKPTRALLVLVLAVGSVLGGSAAASAQSTSLLGTICQTPSTITDGQVTKITRLIYVLPNGTTAVVAAATPAQQASYITKRGTLRTVCWNPS